MLIGTTHKGKGAELRAEPGSEPRQEEGVSCPRCRSVPRAVRLREQDRGQNGLSLVMLQWGSSASDSMNGSSNMQSEKGWSSSYGVFWFSFWSFSEWSVGVAAVSLNPPGVQSWRWHRHGVLRERWLRAPTQPRDALSYPNTQPPAAPLAVLIIARDLGKHQTSPWGKSSFSLYSLQSEMIRRNRRRGGKSSRDWQER